MFGPQRLGIIVKWAVAQERDIWSAIQLGLRAVTVVVRPHDRTNCTGPLTVPVFKLKFQPGKTCRGFVAAIAEPNHDHVSQDHVSFMWLCNWSVAKLSAISLRLLPDSPSNWAKHVCFHKLVILRQTPNF